MTQSTFDPNQIDQLILQRLPALMRQNQQIQELVLELARENFADRQKTEDRFYQLLNELKRDREEQTRKWEEQKQEQDRKWEEQNQKWAEYRKFTQEQKQEQDRKWEEQNRRWEEYRKSTQEQKQEQERKWEEQNRRWEEYRKFTQEQKQEQERKWEEQNRQTQEQKQEQERKWEEQNRQTQEQKQEQERKWEEQNRKWEENQQEIRHMLAMLQKQDRSLGALGARWGIQSENSFRHALAAILEKSFDVKVLNVNEYDDEGTVFGRPDQVELDVIIKNGLLIICEIKSSVSKSDMYIFERKVRFYEKRHQRSVSRMLVISPMVDARAQPVAQQLGIEVYSDSVDVRSL